MDSSYRAYVKDMDGGFITCKQSAAQLGYTCQCMDKLAATCNKMEHTKHIEVMGYVPYPASKAPKTLAVFIRAEAKSNAGKTGHKLEP